MKTNHPAHGPVSLDRLHQIREILSKAAAQSDGGNLGYAMADAVKVIAGVIAAFGAEPVAWLHSDNGIGIPAITRSRNIADSWLSKGWDIKPLYTSPPAPVVPEWTNEQCLEFLSIAFRHAEIKGDLELDDIRLGMKMVNESRDAMLQAGNSPVTPDGWIPVSERMPERDVDVQVYCADKKEQMVGYMERNEADGWFRFASLPNGGGVYCKPTHWMPLPAAPQQD